MPRPRHAGSVAPPHSVANSLAPSNRTQPGADHLGPGLDDDDTDCLRVDGALGFQRVREPVAVPVAPHRALELGDAIKVCALNHLTQHQFTTQRQRSAASAGPIITASAASATKSASRSRCGRSRGRS